MSLCKQIQIWVILVLVLMLVTVLKINMDSIRDLAADQLSDSTKNTAILLSQSLSSGSLNPAQMETVINTAFDQGNFEMIALLHPDGQVIYQRQSKIQVDCVPSFFQNYIRLDLPTEKVQVFRDGAFHGTVAIKLHPRPFYRSMWSTFKLLSLLFIFLALLAGSTSYLILKFILKALNQIYDQAEAICNNQYIVVENISKTPELKKVTLAMNKMVEKVQNIFDQNLEDIKLFKELEFKDPVTGLYNHKYLVKRLKCFLDSDSENAYGYFALIELVGMEKHNISISHPAIQEIFQQLAEILTLAVEPARDAMVARLSQQEFAIILPDCSQEKTMALIQDGMLKLLEMIFKKAYLSDLIELYCGVSPYRYNDDPGSLLSKADYALSVAKNNGSGTIKEFQADDSQVIMGKYQWQTMLYSALVNQRFLLVAQPVHSTSGELHREVFINFADSNGKVYKAGYFMPMAISLGLASRIDKYVLERAAAFLQKNTDTKLAVNITTSFCKDRMVIVWLRQFLEVNQSIQENLFFEINDNSFVQDPEVCIDFTHSLKQMGFGLGIDQFALEDISLNHLKEIKPDYIKIEQDYFQNIKTLGNGEVALNALLSVTESLETKLIVTKIEDEALHKLLINKKIKYFQGYGIAGISPLEVE